VTTLLDVSGIAAGYERQPVISGCSIVVKAGDTSAIVGRNGAGKTTLVSAISGRLPLLAGEIRFSGEQIGHLPAHRRSLKGIVHVPQGREVFATLTVSENLRLASRRVTTDADWQLVFELFPILHQRLQQNAGTLSGGEQQMLAIARAVLTRSKLMILDEPSLGLAPKVVETMFDRVRRLKQAIDISIILVEQQARWVWEAGLVDFVYVLAEGTVAASGTPDELTEEVVQRSYLGAMDAAR
jgi:branched-chain amino acid transport system ATP-binding protein